MELSLFTPWSGINTKTYNETDEHNEEYIKWAKNIKSKRNETHVWSIHILKIEVEYKAKGRA